MRNTPCSRAFKAARQTWNITPATLRRVQCSRSAPKSRKRSSRACSAWTGRRAELRRPAGILQCARSVDAESSCITSGGANGHECELFCHRAPSLCPPAHHSPSRARRVCQELWCRAKSTRFRLELLGKAARARGLMCAARQGSAQAAARLGEPSHVAACGALTVAVVHAWALGRAGARPACT